MAIDFEKTMPGKSDEALLEYIKDRMKYIPPAVEAAINEIQKRGHVFTDEELDNIRKDLTLRQEELANETKTTSRNTNSKVVKDLNAPAYYSERAIYSFSVFFGVFFGSVMLAINLKKTESKKGVLQVILFGIIYTAFQIWASSYLPNATGGTIGFSIVGALILKYFFWNIYIGGDTTYRARPIWIPLLIGLLIFILIILAMIYGGSR